jgi:hypothetical protein
VGPPFTIVALSVADEVPDVRLRVLWDSRDEDSVAHTFPRRRPALEVDVNPSRIPGFGLAVADVVVRARGAAARGVKSALVSHDRGSLERTQQVVLDGEGVGIARLRSAGVGTASVRVTGVTYEAAEKQVQFHWPIAFVVSAMLGGLVGGFIKYAMAKTARRRAVLVIVRSTLIGVLVAVAAAVGINLLGIELPSGYGEALVFVIAALGALKGIRMPGGAATPVVN